MATIKEMLADYNALAQAKGLATIATWKQSGEKLAKRLADLQTDEVVGDVLELVTEQDKGFDVIDPAIEQPDPLATDDEGDAPTGEEIAAKIDELEAAAEKPAKTKKAKAPKVVDERGTIGQMVKDLLLDAEGYDYQEILDIVKGEFPEANTSRRSISSVAADLRRKGTEVPMRRKQKAAK